MYAFHCWCSSRFSRNSCRVAIRLSTSRSTLSLRSCTTANYDNIIMKLKLWTHNLSVHTEFASFKLKNGPEYFYISSETVTSEILRDSDNDSNVSYRSVYFHPLFNLSSYLQPTTADSIHDWCVVNDSYLKFIGVSFIICTILTSIPLCLALKTRSAWVVAPNGSPTTSRATSSLSAPSRIESKNQTT